MQIHLLGTAGEKSLSRNFNLQTLPCSRKGDGTSQSSLRVIWYSAISTVVQGVAAGEKMRANGETIDTLIKDWVTQNTKMERQIAGCRSGYLSSNGKCPALGLNSLYHMLKAHHSCSREKIHRLMKAVGILLYAQKAYKATTNSRHRHPIVPNLLKRQFSLLH